MLATPLESYQWPTHPNCKASKAGKPHILCLKTAYSWAYLQPNTPGVCFRMVFDIDRQNGALAWETAGVAPPNWTVQNPENGHAHLVYEFEVPITVIPNEPLSTKPLRFLALIRSVYETRLAADPAFIGEYVKNPVHQRWRSTIWRREPYDLWELADWVTLSFRVYMCQMHNPSAVAGRNCFLFERLAKWSYSAVRDHWGPSGFSAFSRAAEAQANLINSQISAELPGCEPLGFSEVQSIIRSVTKWTWSHMTSDGFRRWAGRRGSKGGRESRGGGRPRKYNTNAERQRAYRERQKKRSAPRVTKQPISGSALFQTPLVLQRIEWRHGYVLDTSVPFSRLAEHYQGIVSSAIGAESQRVGLSNCSDVQSIDESGTRWLQSQGMAESARRWRIERDRVCKGEELPYRQVMSSSRWHPMRESFNNSADTSCNKQGLFGQVMGGSRLHPKLHQMLPALARAPPIR